jgi:anti-sigma regulatory factor (Ser/Thr protein kinase)
VVVFSGADPSDEAWIAEHVEGFVLKDDELDYLVDMLASLGQEPDEQAAISLPQALPSAGEARRFATKVLTEWEFDTVLDDVLLVISELAANAITHADSPVELRLSRTDNVLRVEVGDKGAGTPEPQPRSTEEEHGRGLQLVGHLTSAWGMQEVPGDGKVVWAEVARPDIDDAAQSSAPAADVPETPSA